MNPVLSVEEVFTGLSPSLVGFTLNVTEGIDLESSLYGSEDGIRQVCLVGNISYPPLSCHYAYGPLSLGTFGRTSD